RSVDVDAQHLAQQSGSVLPVAVRVVPLAAVAEPNVELCVRTEGEVSAVVVRVRLLYEQKLALGRWIDAIRVVAGDPELDDPCVAANVGEVQVDTPGVGVARMERHS